MVSTTNTIIQIYKQLLVETNWDHNISIKTKTIIIWIMETLQILCLLSMHANYFKMIQLLMHMSILYDFEEE